MNIRTFDLNLLRVFDALVSESSVSVAARRLHLSQPATSAALGRLREALGDPLLVRQGSRMVRTPVAEALLPTVQRALADIESTIRDRGAFNPATATRTFRIGASDYAAAILLPSLQKRLQKLGPRMRLDAIPLDDRVELRLGRMELDLALGDRASLRSIECIETLFEEDYLCVARIGHPRLPKRPKLKHYLAERHIVTAPRERITDAVDAALAAIGATREIATTLPHFLVGPMIALQSDLILTTPRHVALHASTTMAVWTFAPPVPISPFPVSMGWAQRQQRDEGLQWLQDQLRRAVRGEAV